MPKPALTAHFDDLEQRLLAALRTGLREWRPDLDYPESTSDMQGAIRGVLKTFYVVPRERPLTNDDLTGRTPR
jgi:hypothetical protein